MASVVRHVHPTRPGDKALAAITSWARRSRARDSLRTAMLTIARPTYTRTLALVPSRAEIPNLLNARGLTGTAVELGVEEGVYSAYLLEHWRGRKLISVDPWREMSDEDYRDTSNVSQASMERNYETTRERLAPFGPRSEIWRETSIEAAAHVEPRSLDFVYLDARHDHDGVAEDLRAWFPLLRPGGLMAGHDYNDGVFYEGVHGVRSAVEEFFKAKSIPVRHTYTDVPAMSWLVQIPQT